MKQTFDFGRVLVVLAAVGVWWVVFSCAQRDLVSSVPLGECRVEVFRRSGGATTGFRYELEAVASTGPEVRVGTIYGVSFLDVRVVSGRLEVEFVPSGNSSPVRDRYDKVCGFPTVYRELEGVPVGRRNLAY